MARKTTSKRAGASSAATSAGRSTSKRSSATTRKKSASTRTTGTTSKATSARARSIADALATLTGRSTRSGAGRTARGTGHATARGGRKASTAATAKSTRASSRGATASATTTTRARRGSTSAGKAADTARAEPAERTTRSRTPRGSRADRAQAAFLEAMERAAQGFYFDAMALFRDVIAVDPRGDLADDALFNIGSLSLQMGLANDAEAAFTELIETYPEGRIAAVAGGQEIGRTAAKAHLGRLRARLALRNQNGARSDLMALATFTDSWVVDASGNRRTFHDLGVEAFT